MKKCVLLAWQDERDNSHTYVHAYTHAPTLCYKHLEMLDELSHHPRVLMDGCVINTRKKGNAQTKDVGENQSPAPGGHRWPQ